jgi:hypothetical protein
MPSLRRQFYDIAAGESVQIGSSRITLEQKSGRRARLLVESDQPTQGPKQRAPDFQRATPTPAPAAGYASLQPPKPGD